MAKITIGDVTGTIDVQVPDNCPAAKSQLLSVISGTSKFVNQVSTPIDKAEFQSATLGATFQNPTVRLDKTRTLTAKAGANSILSRYTHRDTPLLGNDPTVPNIEIGEEDYWMSFELDGSLDIKGAQSLGYGFGVSVDTGSAVKLSTYTLFPGNAQRMPTLGEAAQITLGNFGWLLAAGDLRTQPQGTVCVSDVSGTVTVKGTYTVPLAVNQLALAEAVVPFKVDIAPAISFKASGSVSLTGDHSVRSWRKSANELVLALYKQRGTKLTASFTASAGLEADAGPTDLIEMFFDAVAPGVDLRASGLSKEDPRYAAITAVLNDSVSNALAVSVGASLAGSFGDAAALVYSIDLSGDPDSTDRALNAALAGDWSLLAHLPNAKELRNVLTSTRETKFALSVHLLGLFNYESVNDFVRSSTVLHCPDDGSVTITDKFTAKNIQVASTPYAADEKKLRLAVYQANMITATYATVSGTIGAKLPITQSLRIYHASTSAAALRKDLRLAVAIGEITQAQLEALPISAKPSQVVVDASQTIAGNQAINLLFADPVKRTPRDLTLLTTLGRRVLAALLDSNDSVDRIRIQVLNNDQIWKAMDNQRFPPNSPDSFSDWYDVTFWANAIHDTAAPLKAVLEAIDGLAPGSDPSKDAAFMKARHKLQRELGEVARDTKAAFERGWPIAITYALAGGGTGATMTAKWDGVVRVPASQEVAMRPNALAKRLADRDTSQSKAFGA